MTRAALLVRAGLIAAATLAGWAWLAAKGPVHVIIGTTEIEEFAPTWYMLSAFPILGMLVADVLERARSSGLFARETLLFGVCVAVVVVLANLRLGARLPVSGHVLLLSFFLVHRLAARPWPPSSSFEFAVAGAILVAVSAIKLFHWHDTLTWSVGLVSGGALALICARAARSREFDGPAGSP